MTTRKYNSKLKAVIKSSGLFQWWIAEQCGISKFKMSQIVNGHEAPSASSKRAIAKTLQVKQSAIF
ncbi:hypothetical protein LCGC14_0424840 [marine sediment metagenome]|uniref:HTH cro/C1-type domain-containing protein n=1 Tax=marine sediment metagenome TaxID=412755 RepID=A0A0F9T7W4_9ZZZZ